jgi:starch-binding outer membrane protein, SusD/RagB family
MLSRKLNIAFMLGALSLASCTKLTVDVESELTPSNFPKNTPEEYTAAIGPVYSQLAERYAVDYWRMQELSTDAAIIPAREGNYDDGGRYRFMHLHTWTHSHPYVRDIWSWGFGGINSANRILSLFQLAQESPVKNAGIAELRTMRAFYYFLMMDLYGNIPIVDRWPAEAQPATKKRPEVFAFIEKELKESLPSLDARTGGVTYGRANKWMAFALLQKMYLNAKVYINQDRYNESVAMGDSILINNTVAGLDADYLSIFKPDNGPQIRDIIFAIPYEANLIIGNHFSRFGLHTGIQEKYNLPFRPSIAMSTIPEYYQKFNLPGDVRNATWLTGKQYNNDGSPIMISTTNVGLDDTYNGPDPRAAIKWHLEFFSDLTLKNVAAMDVGNDELGKAKGIRSIKFYPDPNSNPSTRYQNNDFPVLRYADVLLMKAEAIMRGATATTVKGEMQTPVLLVNKIRKRVSAPEVSAITLDELLDERARELAWEGWRRNDLIRFDKFENSWGFKTNTDTYRRIFPIPDTERALNIKLDQNPLY